ncbi:hypothetical protein JHN49_01390 [Streptomyces sp. MBT57]|nr:hypothetical protein [Streptomyces sp. MBT57]
MPFMPCLIFDPAFVTLPALPAVSAVFVASGIVGAVFAAPEESTPGPGNCLGALALVSEDLSVPCSE